MIHFRQSKFLKIIALVVVLVFGSQQLGYAKVIDLLDEGDITIGDVLIAIGSGIVQGYLAGSMQNWSWYRILITQFVVPMATKLILDAAGVDNPIVRAAVMAAASVACNVAWDLSATKEAAKEAPKAVAKEGTKTIAQHIVGQLEKAYRYIADAAKGAVGVNTSQAISQAGKEAMKETMNQAVRTGSRELARQAAKEVAQETLKNITKMTTGMIIQATIIKAAQAAIFAEARVYLYQELSKHNSKLAAYLMSFGGSLVIGEAAGIILSTASGLVYDVDSKYGAYVKKGSLSDINKRTGESYLTGELKSFGRQFLATAADSVIEGVLDEKGEKQMGILLGAMARNLVWNVYTSVVYGDALRQQVDNLTKLKAELETEASDLEKIPSENRTAEQNKQLLEDKEMIAMVDRRLDYTKASLNLGTAVVRGLLGGAITGGLQLGLNEFKNTMQPKVESQWAYFSLGITALGKGLLESLDPRLQEVINLGYAKTSTTDIIIAEVGDSATQAYANFVTMGRAGYDNETGMPEWYRGHDIWYISRYYGYIAAVEKYGFNYITRKNPDGTRQTTAIHYSTINEDDEPFDDRRYDLTSDTKIGFAHLITNTESNVVSGYAIANAVEIVEHLAFLAHMPTFNTTPLNIAHIPTLVVRNPGCAGIANAYADLETAAENLGEEARSAMRSIKQLRLYLAKLEAKEKSGTHLHTGESLFKEKASDYLALRDVVKKSEQGPGTTLQTPQEKTFAADKAKYFYELSKKSEQGQEGAGTASALTPQERAFIEKARYYLDTRELVGRSHDMPGHFGIWYRPEQKLDDEINIRMGAMRAESNLLRSPLLQQPQLMQLLQPGMTLDTRIIQLPPLRDYSPGTQNINTGNIGIKIDNTTDNK